MNIKKRHGHGAISVSTVLYNYIKFLLNIVSLIMTAILGTKNYNWIKTPSHNVKSFSFRKGHGILFCICRLHQFGKGGVCEMLYESGHHSVY